MKKNPKKLALQRETLVALQADILVAIGGGAGSKDIIDWATRYVCPTNSCPGICSIARPCL